MNDFSNSIEFDDLLVITPNPPTAAHYIFIYTIVHCSGKEKNNERKRLRKMVTKLRNAVFFRKDIGHFASCYYLTNRKAFSIQPTASVTS